MNLLNIATISRIILLIVSHDKIRKFFIIVKILADRYQGINCYFCIQLFTMVTAIRHGMRAGLVLLPLLGLAWVFALLSVNDNVLAFHYLFAIFTSLQGIFILLAYVILSREVSLVCFLVLHSQTLR